MGSRTVIPAHGMSVADQMALIRRGTEQIEREADLRQRLEHSLQSGKPLRVKYGIDPTGTDVHPRAGASMNAFLDDVGVELSRIVHGEQRFSYERPLVAGDELTSTLTVASLRQIGGNDIIGTSTTFADATGEVVCTATATLVHRGGTA